MLVYCILLFSLKFVYKLHQKETTLRLLSYDDETYFKVFFIDHFSSIGLHSRELLKSIIKWRTQTPKTFIWCKVINCNANTFMFKSSWRSKDVQSFSNSFEEGTWGCYNIWGGGGVLYFRSSLHFYDPIFQSLLRGYMRWPPPSPLPPPVCI